MVKLLGELEDVKFIERTNRHGPDFVVMVLYPEHGEPMEVELSERLVIMLMWAADRTIEHL